MAPKKAVDSFKKKKWFEIITPKNFNEQVIGETVSLKPEQLIDRKIKVVMKNLTREAKKSHIILHFKVFKVEGTKAMTKFLGFTTDPGYIRRMIRRRVSKMENTNYIPCKDCTIKIKSVIVSYKKLHKGQESSIINAINAKIKEISGKKSFDDLTNEVLFGPFTNKLFSEAKRIAPIKKSEILELSIT